MLNKGLSPTDRHSHSASAVLGMVLPVDTLLYLLLPLYAAQFGVTIAEAGVLLAANRLVRIAGYGWVARFYARQGDRLTCTLAVAVAAICAIGHATLSNFWMLLPLRLLWGLSYAALNLSTQVLATAELDGAARRTGRSRAIIAMGPALALPIGAVLAEAFGPRSIFVLLAGISLIALVVTRELPSAPHPVPQQARGFRIPNSLDTWSFLEGLTLDGLFIIGLSYLGRDSLPGGACSGRRSLARHALPWRNAVESGGWPIGRAIWPRESPGHSVSADQHCADRVWCWLALGLRSEHRDIALAAITLDGSYRSSSYFWPRESPGARVARYVA